MNLLKRIPIPISGLMLALFSLGNLLQDINPYLRYISGILGSLLLTLLILKTIIYTDDIKNDLKNPIIASSSGTFSMSLMILSTYIMELTPSIAYGVWIIGIALHILLMIYFTYNFIITDFDISVVYPSYWIVYVGITMAAITSKSFGLQEVGFLFFIIGFAAMIITSPAIIYRYIAHKDIPNMNKPLICIFTALMSILIVGYLNSSPHISNNFLLILYSIACLFYIFALSRFIKYKNLEFYPSFSAFTFPFVISALATKSILNTIGQSILLNGIVKIETVIAVIITAYVFIKYVKFLKIVKK